MLFGPYMHNQLELVSLALQAQAGCQVATAALAPALAELLGDAAERQRRCVSGKELMASLSNSAAATLQQLR